MQEMGTAGVVERAEGLLPSRHATRPTFEGGKLVSRADGPFRESKRLIGGFCIIEQPSRETALAWADQYGAILRDTEVDLRPLHDQAAWPQ